MTKATYLKSVSHYTGLVSEGKTTYVNLIDCATSKPIAGSLDFARANGIKTYGPKNEAFRNARKVAKMLGYKVVPKNEARDYA